MIALKDIQDSPITSSISAIFLTSKKVEMFFGRVNSNSLNIDWSSSNFIGSCKVTVASSII